MPKAKRRSIDSDSRSWGERGYPLAVSVARLCNRSQQPRQMLLIFLFIALSAGSRGWSMAALVEWTWPAAVVAGRGLCRLCLASAGGTTATPAMKTMHTMRANSFCKSSPQSCQLDCSLDLSCRRCPFRPLSLACRCRPQAPCLVRSRSNPRRLPYRQRSCRASIPLSLHSRSLFADLHRTSQVRSC